MKCAAGITAAQREKILMKLRKKSLIIICAAWLLALAVGVGAIVLLGEEKEKGIEDTETVALVDGSPISFAELKMAAEGFKSQVVAHFYNTYGAEQSETFWNEAHGKETPNERLYSLALEEAVRLKTEQLMMVEYGIVKDISYETYYDSFIAENERRRKALLNDEIIYGPKQYTLKTYFDYVHNNRLISLKELINKEVSGTDTVDYSAANFEVKYAERRKTAQVSPIEAEENQLKENFYALLQ